jgi:predicted transglutaminase-like cysteine proteinase
MTIRVTTLKSIAAGVAFCLVTIALLWASYGPQDMFRGADRSVHDVESAAADLSRWPFGAAEQHFAIDAASSSRMGFLRREIRKGFPIPKAWRTELEMARTESSLALLSTVNVLINKTPYVTEMRDQWKPPVVFLAEGGDCDCFAAAKYILLRDLGFSADDLRITGLHLRKNKRLHVVLVARTGSGKFEKFVLDNIGNYVRTAIYTDEYVPLISLNENGVWTHNRRGQAMAENFANPAKP